MGDSTTHVYRYVFLWKYCMLKEVYMQRQWWHYYNIFVHTSAIAAEKAGAVNVVPSTYVCIVCSNNRCAISQYYTIYIYDLYVTCRLSERVPTCSYVDFLC